MADDEGDKKIVWILGAGFSKALGAPMLSELFTRESLSRALTAWPNAKLDQEIASAVVDLYLGGAHGLKHTPHSRHWEHAEEFLERLDRAKRIPLEEELLSKFANRMNGYAFGTWRAKTQDMFKTWGIDKIRTTALRLMAAECCTFLKDPDLETERWKPYLVWAGKLGRGDTIVTFNYDRVPDLLAKHVGRIKVLSPADEGEISRFRGPKVLKLHGSVDWNTTSNGITATDQPEAALYYENVERFAMATPGPMKRDMIEGEVTLEDGSRLAQPLKPLWEAAEKAIHEAHTIVCIGYRIPPTDAYTRHWLIEALRRNQRMQNARVITEPKPGGPASRLHVVDVWDPLVIHTVLGSNINHEHSQRVGGIFREISHEGRIGVKPWAMFAEDFLGLVTHERLLADR